ncbi:MAG TPA: crosslink repair DNA glycosylase YcaQ family protein [Micromonosporaceae bacterium]
MHTLDRVQARRIAIRAQLLDASRPTDLLAMVRQLTLLQVDPTAAVAPNVDLVAWSRLGASYQPVHLQEALEQHRTLFEYHALIRPMSDLQLYLASMRVWPDWEKYRTWLDANDRFRRDVLALLGSSGPLLSRDVPDTSVVPWPSTGWTNNRNVTQMLEALAMRGDVAIAGRRGKQRLWDLAERVYPADTPVVALAQAQTLRDERRLRSLGMVRENAADAPKGQGSVGQAGERATVDGVAGFWRVDPAALGQPFAGRTALLSPFDRLVYDRTRLADLFEFEYVLEMYKPKAKRRWGYFALPILHQDRLVGKVDATAERKAGMLRVDAIHEDMPFTRTVFNAVYDELTELAPWLGLALGGPAAPRRRR